MGSFLRRILPLILLVISFIGVGSLINACGKDDNPGTTITIKGAGR